jgi:mannose-1-phosphate guanylyltransferase
MNNIQPVILAGGTGTRLWPLSRELYPKQLLNLTEDKSLLQATILRIMSLPDMLPPLVVVVAEEHRFLTLNQIKELGLPEPLRIILEPVGRDTAPAICAAAVDASSFHPEDWCCRPIT